MVQAILRQFLWYPRQHKIDYLDACRNTKDDPVRRQAHRLLASIHQSFADISEKILATDRAQREAADLEAQLSGTRNYALDIERLEADLKMLKGENDLLEQELTS